MFYYPHHINEYRSATTFLSNEEDLAYRRLLEMYYDTEQQIPLETQSVARRLRVGTEALESVLNDFFEPTETGWRNAKCDQVIREYHGMAEKNRRNGKLGGRPKANKQAVENPVGSQSDASGNPEQTHSKPKQNQNQNQKQNHVSPEGDKAPAALSVSELVTDGLTSETAAEWVAHRKRKKASLTPKAWGQIRAEAEKAGWTIENAVLHSLANGWTGFNHDWVRSRGGQAARPSTHSGFGKVNYAEGINDDGSFS